MRPATLISRGKYNPTAQSSGSRNNDRANVLDKNAVSLATGAVFPQRSTATDGDLRRRPVWRERISISSGNYAASFTSGRHSVLFSIKWQRDFATGIYCRDVALFTISTERLTSDATRKKFSLIKNG